MSGPDTDLFCPACGYNVRGTSSERCPECGLVLDRSRLAESMIPWTHRRQIGRVRAYFKTVWMVLRRPTLVGREVAKSQDWVDAVRFRRVTTGIVFVTLAIVAAVIWHRTADFETVLSSVNPISATMATGVIAAPASPTKLDLTLVLLTGWQFWGLLPLYIGVLAVSFTGLMGCFFSSNRLNPEQQARARAISHYSAAPLALLPILGLAWYGLGYLGMAWDYARHYQGPAKMSRPLQFFAEAAILVLLLAWWYDSGKIYRAATHGGLLAQLAATVGMLAGCMLAIVVSIGLLPSIAGFFGLLVASLR
jgi:hypothetical protein